MAVAEPVEATEQIRKVPSSDPSTVSLSELPPPKTATPHHCQFLLVG
jgi:hypothetical protein